MQHFIETIFEGEKHEGFCILTNEDRDAWDAYCAIGTVEVCQKAVEKQKAKKILGKYKSSSIEDIEVFGEDAWFGYCPACKGLQSDLWNEKYCGNCGQKLDWSNEEVTDMENLEARR